MNKNELRKAIKDFAKSKLISKVEINRKIEGKIISFNMKGIKEAINQPHKFYDKKNKAIFNVLKLIQEGKYIGFYDDIKIPKRCIGFHYLETIICEEISFIILKENFDGKVVFYSIVDGIKNKRLSENNRLIL